MNKTITELETELQQLQSAASIRLQAMDQMIQAMERQRLEAALGAGQQIGKLEAEIARQRAASQEEPAQ